MVTVHEINFHDVLIFIIFVVDLAVTKFLSMINSVSTIISKSSIGYIYISIFFLIFCDQSLDKLNLSLGQLGGGKTQ